MKTLLCAFLLMLACCVWADPANSPRQPLHGAEALRIYSTNWSTRAASGPVSVVGMDYFPSGEDGKCTGLFWHPRLTNSGSTSFTNVTLRAEFLDQEGNVLCEDKFDNIEIKAEQRIKATCSSWILTTDWKQTCSMRVSVTSCR